MKPRRLPETARPLINGAQYRAEVIARRGWSPTAWFEQLKVDAQEALRRKPPIRRGAV